MRKIDPDNFRRATRDTPREVNRSILLNLVRERQPISRADLAREMGVARGTITALVNELIEEGLVQEGDTADAPRGRKPTLLHIRSQDWLTVGVDVNRTWTHIQLSDFSGSEINRDRFRTPDSPEALAAELVRRIQELHSVFGHMGSFEGVGVVVPGVVEGSDGRVLNAPTLGWTDVDLLASLREALDFPIHLERDAVACALAHIWLPDQTAYDSTDFVYLAVSEGVGTGLVVNGQVVRGRAYAAGEFGHVPLSLGGPRCSCGSRGCWEAYTSDSATVARYIDACLAEDPPREVEEGDGLSVLDVVDRLREGDRAAHDALSATGRYLGIGLASVINVLNPGTVIVGGEIAHAWDIIEPLVRHQVVTRVLTEQAAATRIVPEADHEEQRLRGASALILAPFFAAPQIA